MPENLPSCPSCNLNKIVKNGKIYNGKQNYKKGKLTIQCDEMRSFVENKGNKQWIWLSLDVKTREIVGVHIGDRSRESAKKLWKSLPPIGEANPTLRSNGESLQRLSAMCRLL